jgi:hypothetical protein
MFTALHEALGESRDSALTYEMLRAAVEVRVSESSGLDWKRALPAESGLGATDFPKDVAAMANSGGGMIVFGVEENDKRATGLVDVGELSERHERALRSVAVSAIHPPVFNLGVIRLGEAGGTAVAVVVPPSVDGPHLIYRGEYFGAPVRNDADTVWMKEQAVASAYRGRFDAQRRLGDDLRDLYDEAASRCSGERAWFVGVARPLRPQAPRRDRFAEPRHLVGDAAGTSDLLLRGRDRRGQVIAKGRGPLGDVDQYNLRPGLRRWVAVPDQPGGPHEAWASFHHDGAVTLACSVGGRRMTADDAFNDTHLFSHALEAGVADLLSMARTVSESELDAEYAVRVGVETRSAEPMLIWTQDQSGYPYDGKSIPLPRFTPVERTVIANATADEFVAQAVEMGLDCINQGGITYLQHLPDPELR